MIWIFHSQYLKGLKQELQEEIPFLPDILRGLNTEVKIYLCNILPLRTSTTHYICNLNTMGISYFSSSVRNMFVQLYSNFNLYANNDHHIPCSK